MDVNGDLMRSLVSKEVMLLHERRNECMTRYADVVYKSILIVRIVAEYITVTQQLS